MVVVRSRWKNACEMLTYINDSIFHLGHHHHHKAKRWETGWTDTVSEQLPTGSRGRAAGRALAAPVSTEEGMRSSRRVSVLVSLSSWYRNRQGLNFNASGNTGEWTIWANERYGVEKWVTVKLNSLHLKVENKYAERNPSFIIALLTGAERTFHELRNAGTMCEFRCCVSGKTCCWLPDGASHLLKFYWTCVKEPSFLEKKNISREDFWSLNMITDGISNLLSIRHVKKLHIWIVTQLQFLMELVKFSYKSKEYATPMEP